MIWHSVPFESLYAEPSRNGVNRPRRVRGSGYKMINMGEIFAYDQLKNPPMELVPLSAQEIEKYGIHEGDLLFARQSLVASGAGKCSIVLDVPEITTFEGHLIRVRMDKSKVNPLFYFYYFSSFAGKGNIQSLVMQVAAAGIRGSELAKLNVPYPPLQIQNKIATILSTYDDLIENNTRSMELLEVSMRILYREWFMQLRFPGYERIKVVDGVPDGWEITNLGQVLEALESGSRPKGGIDPEERDVPSIGAENILGLGKYFYSKEKFVSNDFFINLKRGIVKDQDVLLYKDGAKLGRKTFFRDGFPHEVCCINEHVFILRCNKKCNQSYLYFWLDLPQNSKAIINLNSNAAQPGISQVKVRTLPILLPDRATLSEFEDYVEPSLQLLFNRAKQNLKLRQAREGLLPRLMNGSIPI